MKAKKSKFISLDQLVDTEFGKSGQERRDEFDAGYQSFKLGFLLHEARMHQGLTQEELALKVGTTKSYISKIENDVKEVRLSTLKKIVEVGLGGQLHISIDF
ncbi:helix-turn-helix domain-containing protein [Aquirufa ecclesiirivi]|uniref:helix-turn-helix domain-containing protein n=1 Tax=Aquirufa ecclesiirivi TaxID=2715124 RepID=UPI0022A8BCBE|nr:helix-turn-helix transcriptional regulator [Aquirufa ecclesiirivi]MCZ2472711.1 helix-turn-helix transcriptional regulator [Aquirufa ecclesiirivi]